MKNSLWLAVSLTFTLLNITAYSQEDPNIKIGQEEIIRQGANYYNYADKNKVNIEVSLWGYVRSPGRYLLPQGMRVLDLITLAGGMQSEREIESIKLIRNADAGTGTGKTFDLKNNNEPLPDNMVLQPGDMLIIKPGEPVTYYTSRENISFILSIASALTSITILILNVVNK